MKKILVAVDFTDENELVINYAIKFAKLFGAETCLIHTESIEVYISSFEPEEIPTVEIIDIKKEVISQKLEALKAKFTNNGITAKAVLLEGSTVDNILFEAAEFQADLIIMGSHRHGKFYHLIFGETHTSLINHSKIPIMVIPPK